MATTRELLVRARIEASLTQRALAIAAHIPQASVSRIERGRISPRARTVERWLATCGKTLEMRPRSGEGVDRSLIRARLAMTPGQRSQLGVQEARAMIALERAKLRRATP